MKVNIKISKANEKLEMIESSDIVCIEFPFSYYAASKMSGFSMYTNGTGSYLGPNQMFGGPKGGDLILFDNVKGRQFYAIMTSMTQGWHSREGKIKFVCFRDEIINRIIDGLKRESKSEELIFKYMTPMIGLTRTVDICIDISSNRIKEFINKK